MTSGYVYFVHAIGTSMYKIGITSGSVKSRMSTLSTASPIPLTLIYSLQTGVYAQVEAALHARYAAYRKHGEWFDMDAETMNSVIEVMQDHGRLINDIPEVLRKLEIKAKDSEELAKKASADAKKRKGYERHTFLTMEEDFINKAAALAEEVKKLRSKLQFVEFV